MRVSVVQSEHGTTIVPQLLATIIIVSLSWQAHEADPHLYVVPHSRRLRFCFVGSVGGTSF